MLDQSVIEKLTGEAKTNAASYDVFLLLAVRKRTRSNTSVSSVHRQLLAAGFKHPVLAVIHVFKLLSDLGLGSLRVSPRGQIRGLKDVKYTLQSIGQAAIGGEKATIEGFRPRNRYQVLPAHRPVVQKPEVVKAIEVPVDNDIALVLSIHGK